MRNLPAVLSPDEIVRLRDATPEFTARAMLATICSGGLRLREARRLLVSVSVIDSARNVAWSRAKAEPAGS